MYSHDVKFADTRPEVSDKGQKWAMMNKWMELKRLTRQIKFSLK